MKKIIPLAAFVTCLVPSLAQPFCGFYVAKADAKLFNQSSQVVYSRDGDRSIVTMGSDFKGDVKEFALVVPVPVILQKQQVKLVNNSTIKHIDAFTAPRLVEYYDENPCAEAEMATEASIMPAPLAATAKAARKETRVKIEVQYTLGEYDIMVLSAQESTGLIDWLNENSYKIPAGAENVIGSYLKQNMKFFIAKVNLKEYAKTGFTQLRPIQVNYREKRFMLPIRLGTVNAAGKQDLFVYGLSQKGRIETTNYRTVKIPTDVDIPEYIKTKQQFAPFYRSLFNTQAAKADDVVFLEYAWNVNSCDPCVTESLTNEELNELGAFWVNKGTGDTYVTRLHVRYDRETFPEDLMFQVTGNTESFQGRYTIHHAWQGEVSCPAATTYLTKTLPKRREAEAKNLAHLTNWDINDIRKNMLPIPQVKDALPKISE